MARSEAALAAAQDITFFDDLGLPKPDYQEVIHREDAVDNVLPTRVEIDTLTSPDESTRKVTPSRAPEDMNQAGSFEKLAGMMGDSSAR